MKMRWARRRYRATQGFVLAEALVALTVAALTLALLTSATFGLRQTAMQPSLLQQEATDWLTARRVLQAWAASATTSGAPLTETRFLGTPTEMRLVIDDSTTRSSRPVMVGLTITQEDELFRLSAARHFGVRDVRLSNDDARESTIVVSDQPLRFVYSVSISRGSDEIRWTEEPDIARGLPTAVAVERGEERMIAAPMPSTRSAACVSRLGLLGLEELDCELR